VVEYQPDSFDDGTTPEEILRTNGRKYLSLVAEASSQVRYINVMPISDKIVTVMFRSM